LEKTENGVQPLLDIFIFRFHQLLLPDNMLQILIWLLRGQFLDFSFQRFDLAPGPFADGSLCFPIVCSLLG
jgi:hypothetical protein